jgi:hypothetical protein
MPEWLAFVLFIAAYVVLLKLLLPRFGARTCRFGSCRVDSVIEPKSQSPAAKLSSTHAAGGSSR